MTAYRPTGNSNYIQCQFHHFLKHAGNTISICRKILNASTNRDLRYV